MTNINDFVDTAIRDADPYRGRGTDYLHTHNIVGPKESNGGLNHEHQNLEENPTGAVVVPISLATTFQQTAPGKATAVNDPNSMGIGYEYSRTGNPTRGAFERAMVKAEQGANYCVAFSSGSAATSAVMHLLKHGDHCLSVDDVYGGTQRYFRRILTPNAGIQVDFVDMSDAEKLEFKDNTKLVWLESPTNPTLKITDIRAIAKKCKEHGCLLAVDNTFCSPYFQSPLNLGADLAVHSVTKYIGGHSDVVMGVVCCKEVALYDKLRFIQNGVGAVPSPFDCFLAHRGLKTLHLRMEAAARNAMAVALFLQDHPAVRSVIYPGLKSHPQHELAKEQQYGYGAMVSFSCIGGRAEASILLKNVS